MPKEEERRGMAYFKNHRNLKASIVDIKGARFLSKNHGKSLKRIRAPLAGSSGLSGPSTTTTRSPRLAIGKTPSLTSQTTPLVSKKFTPNFSSPRLLFSTRTKLKRIPLRSNLLKQKRPSFGRLKINNNLSKLKRIRTDSGSGRALTNYNRRVPSRLSQIGPKFVKKKLDVEPCSFFTRFGECKRSFCKFSHEKTNIKEVNDYNNRFLKAKTCDKDGCKLSHNFEVGKLPPCRFFKQGFCVNDDCPYLHVNTSPKVDTKVINNSKGKSISKSKLASRLKENNKGSKKTNLTFKKPEAKSNVENEVKVSRYYAKELTKEESPKPIETKVVEAPCVKPTVIEDRRTRLLNKLSSLKQRLASNSIVQPNPSESYTGKGSKSTNNMPDFMPL